MPVFAICICSVFIKHIFAKLVAFINQVSIGGKEKATACRGFICISVALYDYSSLDLLLALSPRGNT